MVSSSTYHAVWDGLLDVARAVHYYAELERRYRQYTHISRALLALSGTGAGVGLIVSLTPIFGNWMAAEIISAVAGFFVTLLVIVDLIFNGSSRVAKLRDVNQKLAALEADYRVFWEKVREGAIDNLDAIEIKIRMSQQRVEYEAFAAMPPNAGLNRITQRQAFQVEEQRYAAPP